MYVKDENGKYKLVDNAKGNCAAAENEDDNDNDKEILLTISKAAYQEREHVVYEIKRKIDELELLRKQL